MAQLIPEEERNKESNFEQQVKNNDKKEKERYRSQPRREEHKKEKDLYMIENETNSCNCFTIWDLPVNINAEKIRHMCKNFKKVQIKRIKKSKHKALAVVQADQLINKNIL